MAGTHKIPLGIIFALSYLLLNLRYALKREGLLFKPTRYFGGILLDINTGIGLAGQIWNLIKGAKDFRLRKKRKQFVDNLLPLLHRDTLELSNQLHANILNRYFVAKARDKGDYTVFELSTQEKERKTIDKIRVDYREFILSLQDLVANEGGIFDTQAGVIPNWRNTVSSLVTSASAIIDLPDAGIFNLAMHGASLNNGFFAVRAKNQPSIKTPQKQCPICLGEEKKVTRLGESVDCWGCKGTGLVENWMDLCKKCHGDGNIVKVLGKDLWITCPRCNGRGLWDTRIES